MSSWGQPRQLKDSVLSLHSLFLILGRPEGEGPEESEARRQETEFLKHPGEGHLSNI